MASSATVAICKEKRKPELCETFHRIYCMLSNRVGIWHQLRARVYGHHPQASGSARGTRIAIRPFWLPVQDTEVHEISRRDTGVIGNPITSAD
jgi:hypothetical protein